MNQENPIPREAEQGATRTASCCERGADVRPSETERELKAIVQAKYAAVATGADEDCGCGPSCCGDGAELSMIGDAYDGVEGYVAEADLGLGCGLPTELANLRLGDVVLDLGSGAGLDAFVARSIVGEAGRVIGVDMTPEMIAKARANAERLGYANVAFLLGDLEALPLEDGSVDVVISNCVLNLVPDKARAFAEMYRVLRAGGHFCVSDVVASGPLPPAIQRSAALYAGCVAGVMEEEAYLAKLREAGFADVRVARQRPIDLPDEALLAYVAPEELAALRRSGVALRSVTVYGERGA